MPKTKLLLFLILIAFGRSNADPPVPEPDITNPLIGLDVVLLRFLATMSKETSKIDKCLHSSAQTLFSGLGDIAQAMLDTGTIIPKRIGSAVEDMLPGGVFGGDQLRELIDRVTYCFQSSDDKGVGQKAFDALAECSKRILNPVDDIDDMTQMLYSGVQNVPGAFNEMSEASGLQEMAKVTAGNAVSVARLVGQVLLKLGGTGVDAAGGIPLVMACVVEKGAINEPLNLAKSLYNTYKCLSA